MRTKTHIAQAAAKLHEAEEALEEAKADHEEAFREALVALFCEYGLALTAAGYEGSRFQVREITGTYTRADLEGEF